MQSKFRSNKARNVYNSLSDNGIISIIDTTINENSTKIINTDSILGEKLINNPRVIFLLFPDNLVALAISFSLARRFLAIRDKVLPKMRILNCKDLEEHIRSQNDFYKFNYDLKAIESKPNVNITNGLLKSLKYSSNIDPYYLVGDKILGLYGPKQNQEYFRGTIMETTNYGYLVRFDKYQDDGVFLVEYDSIVKILRLGTFVLAELDEIIEGNVVSLEVKDSSEYYNILDSQGRVHNVEVKDIIYVQPILQPTNYQIDTGIDIEKIRLDLENLEVEMKKDKEDIEETLQKHNLQKQNLQKHNLQKQNKRQKIVFSSDSEELPYYEGVQDEEQSSLCSSDESHYSGDESEGELLIDKSVTLPTKPLQPMIGCEEVRQQLFRHKYRDVLDELKSRFNNNCTWDREWSNQNWSSWDDSNWLNGWNNSLPNFVEPNQIEKTPCDNNTGVVDWNSLAPDTAWGNAQAEESESDGWDHVERECEIGHNIV